MLMRESLVVVVPVLTVLTLWSCGQPSAPFVPMQTPPIFGNGKLSPYAGNRPIQNSQNTQSVWAAQSEIDLDGNRFDYAATMESESKNKVYVKDCTRLRYQKKDDSGAPIYLDSASMSVRFCTPLHQICVSSPVNPGPNGLKNLHGNVVSQYLILKRGMPDAATEIQWFQEDLPVTAGKCEEINSRD